MKKIPQDIIGDIAILKFPRRMLWIRKKFLARKFLKEKSVKTVLEKVEGFSGRLRILSTRYLAGENTKETTCRENDCIFRLNVDETYFSPRLSNERKVLAEKISKVIKGKNKKILVMFAGVGPFSIVLARKLKLQNKFATIYSNELNTKANRYAEENIHLNKVRELIKIIPGDANKLPSKIKEKFKFILMPRPNLKDTFLKSALKMSKKGTTIFYYGFGTRDGVLDEIKNDAKEKVKIIDVREAGDIGVGKYRWLVEMKVN